MANEKRVQLELTEDQLNALQERLQEDRDDDTIGDDLGAILDKIDAGDVVTLDAE